MIYCIQQGTDGPIKVGYTDMGVMERLAALQVGNPQKLYLIATHTGTKTDEKEVHKRLLKHKLIGEWFAGDATLVFIQSYAYQNFMGQKKFNDPERNVPKTQAQKQTRAQRQKEYRDRQRAEIATLKEENARLKQVAQ